MKPPPVKRGSSKAMEVAAQRRRCALGVTAATLAAAALLCIVATLPSSQLGGARASLAAEESSHRAATELLEVSDGSEESGVRAATATPGPTAQNAAGLPLLRPSKMQLAGHELYYESPPHPIGLLLILHKCGRSATDHWPRTQACPDCLGLPQSLAKTKQALSRGYAVAAMSSKDRRVGRGARCFAWADDAQAAEAAVKTLPQRLGLPSGAPVYLDGASSGGSLALRLPSIVQVDGVVGEVIAPPGLADVLARMKAANKTRMPPALYIHMPLDQGMAAKVEENMAALRDNGVPAAEIEIDPQPIGAAFFSDCSHAISPPLSTALHKKLKELDLVDEDGLITVEPADGAWAPFKSLAASSSALSKLLASLKPEQQEQSATVVSPHIWECINGAWARHETVGEHMTAALTWLESKGRADIKQLVQRHRPAKLSALTVSTSGAGWRRRQPARPPPAVRRKSAAL